MTAAKHAKGPLTVRRSEVANYTGFDLIDAQGAWVASVHSYGQADNRVERAEKNAHLFKAAPQLLAALKQCLPLVDDYDGPASHEAIAARAAIAAAGGDA